MKNSHPSKRQYRMAARAEAMAATGRRILEAAIQQLGARPYDEVTLADIASQAGVTVQTVLRRFGSKEGLTEAAAARGAEDVRSQRWAPEPGNVDAAVHALAEHYESWGDRALHFLAQEARVDAMRRVTDAGRALHHAWVDHVFGPHLSAVAGALRHQLRAELIAVTDVYVWKIMRRDLGLDATSTERAMLGLASAVVRRGGER